MNKINGEKMNRTYKKTILLLCAIGFLFFNFLPSVQGIGLGLSPQTMELPDLAGGQEYEEQMVIYNIGNYTENFSIWAEGDGGEWIYFYAKEDVNHTTPLGNITIPGESRSFVTVLFKIENDPPLGEFNPKIFVQAAPPPGDDAGQTVSVVSSIDVNMEVTGEENLDGEVRSVTVNPNVTGDKSGDVERGETLEVLVTFKNTGNVIAKPEIIVEIIKDGFILDNITRSDTSVKPSQTEDIPVLWNTYGRECVNYTAHVKIMLGDKTLYDDDKLFEIHSPGVISTRGTLIDFSYEGELISGKTIKIIATFRNLGETSVSARFLGEVYKDGDFLKTIESEEILIEQQYAEESLVVYLPVDEEGNYEVKGYVSYKGGDIRKITDTLTLSFEVRSSTNLGLLIGIGIGIPFGIIVIYIARKKKMAVKKKAKKKVVSKREQLRAKREQKRIGKRGKKRATKKLDVRSKRERKKAEKIRKKPKPAALKSKRKAKKKEKPKAKKLKKTLASTKKTKAIKTSDTKKPKVKKEISRPKEG